MFILTDIHTHDSVSLNVYSLTISMLNNLVNIKYCCFNEMSSRSPGADSKFRKKYTLRHMNCVSQVLQG